MKIGITGHTAGIGKYIFENYPNVQGFSRSNGFDISKKYNRKKILDNLRDIDWFINSAYSEFHQSSLLLEFWLKYRWQNKRIINIGSKAAENEFSENNISIIEYAMHKRSLKDLCVNLQKCNSQVSLSYVNLDYVYTGKTEVPLMPNYITVAQAATIIMESNNDTF